MSRRGTERPLRGRFVRGYLCVCTYAFSGWVMPADLIHARPATWADIGSSTSFGPPDTARAMARAATTSSTCARFTTSTTSTDVRAEV